MHETTGVKVLTIRGVTEDEKADAGIDAICLGDS